MKLLSGLFHGRLLEVHFKVEFEVEISCCCHIAIINYWTGVV